MQAQMGWKSRLVGPRLPWLKAPLRPAEVGEALCACLLDRKFLLEDAHFRKIVPNQFVVELEQENFQDHYAPLLGRILEQWREMMLEHLATANSRQGRKEYSLAGSLELEVRPAAGLQDHQARILCRIAPAEEGGPSRVDALPACLEMESTGQRWQLYPGVLVLGRDPGCDISFQDPLVQEKRLVSSRHAYLRCEADNYRLFDGTPEGKPSTNGTFINRRRVPPEGIALQDGDQIILASLHPTAPNPYTPGSVLLRFVLDCR